MLMLMKTGRPIIIVTALAFALGGCGNLRELKPVAGQTPPAVAYGAQTPETATQLLEPSVQARPERNVELLSRSVERTDDEFDLPPE